MTEAKKPKKKSLFIALGIVIVAVVAIVAYIFLAQPGIAIFKIEMRDFGYNAAKYGPTLTVQVGQRVRMDVVNAGVVGHELMIVTKDWVDKALRNPNDPEIHEEVEEIGPVFRGAEIELEPGESATIEFVADKEGSYYYACFEMEPENTNHVARGMYAEFKVKR